VLPRSVFKDLKENLNGVKFSPVRCVCRNIFGGTTAKSKDNDNSLHCNI